MSHEPKTCQQIAAAVQAGEQTARSIAEQALAEAERLQERFRAFITPTPEPARQQAERVHAMVQEGRRTADLPGGQTPLLHAYLGLLLPLNLSGHPAVSVPCGFSKDGLPIGMQLVGRPFDEAMILRVGHQYQEKTDWHRRVAPA